MQSKTKKPGALPATPTKGAAPTVATVATPSKAVALPTAPVHGGSKGAAVAVPVALGTLCTVPTTNGVATFCAPVTGQYSAGAKPAAWPPLYTVQAGCVATPPNPGARGCWAVLAVVPNGNGGHAWGTVHVYNGHANNTAGSHGNGALVATAAPCGAVLYPQPQPGAVLATAAKGLGL